MLLSQITENISHKQSEKHDHKYNRKCQSILRRCVKNGQNLTTPSGKYTKSFLKYKPTSVLMLKIKHARHAAQKQIEQNGYRKGRTALTLFNGDVFRIQGCYEAGLGQRILEREQLIFGNGL